MRILRLPEVKRVLGHRSDASVYNAIRAGLFPAGVAVGRRARGWPDYEVYAIAEVRIAGLNDDRLREIVADLEFRRATLVMGGVK